jgi:hypothetical protein
MRILVEIATCLVLLVVAAGSYCIIQFFCTGQVPEIAALMLGAIAAFAVRHRLLPKR